MTDQPGCPCSICEDDASVGQFAQPDYAYPRDYTDRQLLESVWRKIDGLAAMVAGPTHMHPDAHPDDIAEMVAAWKPTHNEENQP